MGAAMICVWKWGASADTSHWNTPLSGLPTDSRVTCFASDTDTWKPERSSAGAVNCSCRN